ncbi:hypothetical protein [Corynebacterium tuscaniense]|uniref:hypothetical protein n=1 Tax=Corynebacterium tuscaniense TaxID=302449 RepID=UPI00123A1E42|nr:hypothetical protein [Corynebacterium tuscaniense]KAA8730707.1 hypothetical protein F4V54_10310 [Corynebacterium tuscaniense]
MANNSSNSSESKDESISGRQALFLYIGLMASLAGALLYGITLIVLASLVTLGSIGVGVFFILRSYDTGSTKLGPISGEIEQLKNEASFDVSEELIAWDKMKYTKGIGTKLEGQIGDIDNIHRRLVNARDELAQAETPVHRVEAVLAADSVLALARELRAPEPTWE